MTLTTAEEITQEIPIIELDGRFDTAEFDVAALNRAEFDPAAFELEMERVIQETAIERAWTRDSGLRPFASDGEILLAAQNGQVRRVSEGIGFLTIQSQGKWSPERSNPEHEYHYSPPYLRPEAARMLQYIGHRWSRQLGWGWAHRLSVTSMSRSLPYQQSREDIVGKLAISPKIGLSTHVYGLAFDIDACGLYVAKNLSPFDYMAGALNDLEADWDIYERFINVNPRRDGYSEHANTVAAGLTVLLDILGDLVDRGEINVVKENAGTTNSCLHVAVNPLALAA